MKTMKTKKKKEKKGLRALYEKGCWTSEGRKPTQRRTRELRARAILENVVSRNDLATTWPPRGENAAMFLGWFAFGSKAACL